MNSHIDSVTLTVTHSSLAPVDETLELIPLSLATRLKRAARYLGVIWAVALFSFFIPLLHFVLVPAFLVLGLVSAVWVFIPSVKAGNLSALKCPKCKLNQMESESSGWPLILDCQSCGAVVEARLR